MDKKYISVIKASAGSGKTYTLARTYISHLLGTPTGKKVNVNGMEVPQFRLTHSRDYHKHLLAITFTNKATNEMKQRIVKQLFKLSNGKGDFVDDFKQMFIYNDFNEVTTAARQALSDILFNYDTFNVSTIDSFFQGILRNFARELNHDYNYNIQLDLDYVTSVAVHDFLMDLGNPTRGTAAVDQWVKDFIADKINKKKKWNFFGNTAELEKFAQNIYREVFREHHDAIVDYLSDIGDGHGTSRINQFRQFCITQRNQHSQSYDDCLKQFKIFFDNNGIAHTIRGGRIVKKLYDQSYTTLSDDNHKTLDSYAQDSCALTTHVVSKKWVNDISIDLIDEFRQLCATTMTHHHMAELYDSALDNIWNLGLLGKIDEKLEAFRKDTNSILIADTNDLIGRVLDCGATFIYEHTGTVLYNYMIDEFQDTSRKQYSNFKPLLQEAISNGKDNLIIGDEKQSIYRFRNSDPSLLRREIGEDFDIDSTTLDTNYRSYPAIVSFNNAFFKAIIDDYNNHGCDYELLTATFSNIVQKCKKNSSNGLVKVNIVKNESGVKQKIIQALPHYVNQLRQRGYEPKDIAILVNTNDEGKAIVEQILYYNDSLGNTSHPHYINVISDEALLLKNSPAVRLIVSVLQFLENSQFNIDSDEENSTTDNEPFKKFLKKRLREQKRNKVLHDFETLMQNESLEEKAGEILVDCFKRERINDNETDVEKRISAFSATAQELMPDHRNQLTNLLTIVEKIIDHYIVPQGDVENAFIQGFMNVVVEFNRQRNGGTVREFLHYWETKKNKLTINSPSEANAVNVMTIHKSKGLEFKCVIIPFANWDLVKLDKIFWIKDKDWEAQGLSSPQSHDMTPPLIPVSTSKLEGINRFNDILNIEKQMSLIDNLNKLYVALTRPKEELHIFATDNESKDKKKKIDDLGISEISTASSLIMRYVTTSKLNSELLNGFELTVSEDTISCFTKEESGTDSNDDTLNVTSIEMGTPMVASAQNEKEQTKEDAENHSVSNMPVYRYSPQVMPVRVSMHKTSGSITHQGIRMHEIFSQINSVNDFNRALNYGINNELFKSNSYWTEERFKQLLSTIQSDATLSKWFDPASTVYNERNICMLTSEENGGEKNYEHLRPDRIVRLPNGEILVIDYKFGFKHDTATIADDSKKVGDYIRELRPLLDSDDIKGYLWYARYNVIVPVEG